MNLKAENVSKQLKQAGYRSFINERTKISPIDMFDSVFFCRYVEDDGTWSFKVKKHNLHCINQKKFKFVFPLIK